jgi:hypothetical protein
MYPHERSLVKNLEGRPFALLGVNSDGKAELKKAMEREGITWRSWWDGGSANGPIARQWNVTGWPTIYVIDHKGVIRHKNYRGDLEQVVLPLLKEAEAAGP